MNRRLESRGEHESRKPAPEAEVERRGAFGKGGLQRLAICALAKLSAQAVDYMEGNLGRVDALAVRLVRAPHKARVTAFFRILSRKTGRGASVVSLSHPLRARAPRWLFSNIGFT